MKTAAAPGLLQRDPPEPDLKANLPVISHIIFSDIQKLVARKYTNFGAYCISSANYQHDPVTKLGPMFLFGRKKNLGKQIRILPDGSVEHF